MELILIQVIKMVISESVYPNEAARAKVKKKQQSPFPTLVEEGRGGEQR